MNGDCFDQSPLKDFVQSKLKERDATFRLPLYSDWPSYASAIGVHNRYGFCGFDSGAYCTNDTTYEGWRDRMPNARGLAEPSVTQNPGDVVASIGGVSPGTNQGDPRKPLRYLTMAAHHDCTNLIGPNYETEQVSEDYTWKIDPRTGAVYDIVIAWSGHTWGGTSYPSGSAHLWCGDDGVLNVSGDDLASFWTHLGDGNLALGWWGDPSMQGTSVTVTETHAIATGSATLIGGSAPNQITYTMSEKYEVTASNPIDVNAARLTAMALLAMIPSFGSTYSVWDDGTQTATPTKLDWGVMLFAQYDAGFPVRARIRSGAPYGIDISRAAKALYQNNPSGVYLFPITVICKRVWCYGPWKKRVCWTAAEWTTPAPNTNGPGLPDNGGWSVANGNLIGKRFDGAGVFMVGPEDITFTWGEGQPPLWEGFIDTSNWPAVCHLP